MCTGEVRKYCKRACTHRVAWVDGEDAGSESWVDFARDRVAGTAN